MKKYNISAVFVIVVLLLSAPVMAQKTYTFGEKQGEAVPTNYEIQERRFTDVANKIADVSAQIAALQASQQKTNEELGKLLQTSMANLQEMQKLNTLMATQAGRPGAAPVASAPATPTTSVDAQRALTMELSRGMREQGETMKLMVTIMNQMAEEQKVTNSLLESLGKK
jgi:hypothetical protein